MPHRAKRIRTRYADLSDVSTTAPADGQSPRWDAASGTYIPTSSKMVANVQADDYTLVLSDAGKRIEMGKATGQNLTVPTNAVAAFPIGTIIDAYQEGAGQLTIVGAGGVTLHSAGGQVAATAQYSLIRLYKQSANVWCLSGDLA